MLRIPKCGTLSLVRTKAGAVTIPINRLLAGSSLRPDEIRIMNEAHEGALRALCLVDRNDLLTELVARKIIEVGRASPAGLDPARISSLAIKALGLQ